MKHLALASAVVLCLLISVVLFAQTAAAQEAASVEATLTLLGGSPGAQLYRFDYKLINDAVFPAAGGLDIFFDSDGVDRADYVSTSSPTDWEPFVSTDPDPSPWFVEWMNYVGTNLIPVGGSLSGFSVTFIWKDPAIIPSVQHFEAMNGFAHSGETSVVAIIGLAGDIAGNITSSCGKCGTITTVPAAGVTIDLFDANMVMLGTFDSNDLGNFSFPGLAAGTYYVTVVRPLGYNADAQTKTVIVIAGETATVTFALKCIPICNDPESVGYWKHQVNSHTCNKGRAQESLSKMMKYIDLIKVHFNENTYNPVIVYEVDANPATRADSLRALKQLLTINREFTMLDKARQQCLGLLLNVVSLKISQSAVVSADGATVSQAITYGNELMTDGITINDRIAKDMFERINDGEKVGAGIIPLATPTILYELKPGTLDITRTPSELSLAAGYPNPSKDNVSFVVGIPEGTGNIRARVYNAKGGLVKTLTDGSAVPGIHTLVWDGKFNNGEKVPSGTYFMRVESDREVKVGKMIVSR